MVCKKVIFGIESSLKDLSEGFALESEYRKKIYVSKNIGQIKSFMNEKEVCVSDAELYEGLIYLMNKGDVKLYRKEFNNFWCCCDFALDYFYLAK